MSNIGIIILAAGASTRLGQPKQILAYQGKSLIRHITEAVINSQCRPVVVVLGAYVETIEPHLRNLDIHIVGVAESKYESCDRLKVAGA